MVERRLAKAKVAGSSPVIRSRTMRVRFIRIRICYKLNTAPWPSGKARVCKTLIPGPIPGGASKKRRTRTACPSLFGDATHESDQALCANGAQNPVRFRRSEIDKLACQAESERIFAEGEITGSENLFVLTSLCDQREQNITVR